MNDDVRRWLDEELPLADLDADARARAESWSRLLDAFRDEAPPAPPPVWLEDRVMAEIGALPTPGRLSRGLAWLLRPHAVHVPPLAAGLAFAAVAALALWAGRARAPVAAPGGAAAPGVAQAVVYVQFELRAPGAHSVSVGGDFDGWSGANPLEDPDGDGVWTGRVAVSPGVHAYMFLVDGDAWVTDPEATRYNDDGFGNRNAVLAVAAPST